MDIHTATEQAYRNGYEAGKRDAEPKWIPVTKRLPEKECDCLIYTTIYYTPDHVDECNHYDGIVIAGYHPRYGFMGKGGLHAKAWMPIPNPPTE